MENTLINGASYNWAITVTDRAGNQAQRQTTFTGTSLPAISGFSPPGGLAGTIVTITGVNFSPTASLNTVYFNGVRARIAAASGGSLSAEVPVGASTGKITVLTGGHSAASARDFQVASPVGMTGVIRNSAETALAGTKVEVVEDPSISDLTAADGSYLLQPLFSGQIVTLKITKSGYVPTYTGSLGVTGTLNPTRHLYTAAELIPYGAAAGKGLLIGKVVNNLLTPATPIAGVTVTAASSNGGISYPVVYYNGTAFGGSSTYANGKFVVRSVTDYDRVSLGLSKSGWSFAEREYQVRADSVTEGVVYGYTSPPIVAGFSPSSGNAGSSVTITGSYFSPVAGENTVRFNGTAATVVAASSNSLTVTVPAGATTGPISVTTSGGTGSSGMSFSRSYTLTASVLPSGAPRGTLTILPAGEACRSTGCTVEVYQGTMVQVNATADAGARLSSWGGACTGTGACSFPMTGNSELTATFLQDLYIKVGSSYYSSLQSAFDAAGNGNTVQVQGVVLAGNVWHFFPPAGAQVRLKGGYDSSFMTNPGITTLDGRLNLQGGTLRVEKIRVR